MDPERIVAGGGWITQSRRVRRWTRRWRMLAVLWLFLSFAALGWLWIRVPGSSSRVADWVSLLTLCLQGIFVVVAFVVGAREQPTEIAVQIPNPNYDPRNLY